MNIELNVSCPNTEKHMINDGLGDFVNEQRKWCIVKLSPHADDELIDKFYKQGFRQFQMKVGAEPSVDIRRITSVAKHLKPGNVLGADANCGWNQHDAIRLVKAISNIDVYIEQPFFTYEECRGVDQLLIKMKKQTGKKCTLGLYHRLSNTGLVLDFKSWDSLELEMPGKSKGLRELDTNILHSFLLKNVFFDEGSDPPRPIPQDPHQNSAQNDVLASSPSFFLDPFVTKTLFLFQTILS